MIKFISKIFFVFIVALLSSSCTLLILGPKQKIKINSNQQAQVYMNGNIIGNTNEDIKIKRSDIHKYYEVKKEGCETYGQTLPKRTPITFQLNYLNFIGFFIDGIFECEKATYYQHEINIECPE